MTLWIAVVLYLLGCDRAFPLSPFGTDLEVPLLEAAAAAEEDDP